MSLTKSEGSSGRVECLSVVVHKDEKGYGMTVSGNDPVLVQSVVKNGAAWKAGVRYGDKLLRVNGTSVETAVHQDVVDMIKSSNMVELFLQRANTSKITAPIPVDREIQRQVENTRRLTLRRMLESQNNHIDSLRSALARGDNSCISELEAAEIKRTHLQQQLEKLEHPIIITPPNRMIVSEIDPPPTPSRQGILSNIPRSLSGLTGQSIRINRCSQPPVTCLDGTPPPLPPRTPTAQSPNNHSPKGPSPGGQVPKAPPVNMFNRHMEPNSIGVQMNYPLAVTHPPIQSGIMGHQRSRSSPEQLVQLNNSVDKDWDGVFTPPGTPPPPYPSSPISQPPIESQRAILSMEEDESPWPIIHHSTYYNKSFSNVDSLSPARMAIFLNWIIGERRPPQAALLYLLTAVYNSSSSEFLNHWPYELHSAFLVPGAPLLLHNVDENMAKKIDDVLMNITDKDILKKIFLSVREKAKEELNDQLNEFQVKRQSGLGAFYGPADSVLEQCDNDRQKELSVISEWLLPQLNLWLKESGADHWEATYGSSAVSLLAAAVHPLLRFFGFKSQMINEMLRSPIPGSPPRPEFLQPNRHYKQRVRHLKKSTTHPLIIRGHHLSPIAVVSVSHCQHCHLLIWGIAPQAYICSDCKLIVHRCCAKEIEENCCGPAPLASRKSRLMEKLAPPVLSSNAGNSHQHIDSNQHFYLHHHYHDKKQRKSIGTSNFLNMERNSRRNEEDLSGMDLNASYHSDLEFEVNGLDEIHHDQEEKNKTEDEDENRDAFKETDSTTVVLTDSECEPDKKKKSKTKHRKTMSVSNTIELVRSMGDEWIEAAKREIGEHSKKREIMRKKKEQSPTDQDKKHSVEHNDNVVLLLSDATITETDDFETVEQLPVNKSNKKKEAKVKDMTPKVSSNQIMPAQKMAVRMIAKASTVSALNFIRKKRPAPIAAGNENLVDHILLSTALFIDSEKTHTEMVRDENEKFTPKRIETSDGSINSSDEVDAEIFYDAKATSHEDSDTAEEELIVKKSSTKSESKKSSKTSNDPKVLGLRSRKTFGGSLKRTNGGRRKGKRRSSTEEAPPLPPKGFLPPPPPPKPSHWLFGNSFKGDSRRDADDNTTDGSTHHSDTSHQFLEHSLDIADAKKSTGRQRPMKTESFRDKASNVQRTKRNTSDPKLLASEIAQNDAEASGLHSGHADSSSSSISSSNEHIDDGDIHSEVIEDEERTEPWSSKALPDILKPMSSKARKRQDLIHELIASEVSHVRWLRILRQVFYNSLHQHKVLPENEMKNLFPNLPSVLQKHRKLCTDLKALAAESPIIQTKPLADALISTLGEPKYSQALAKFCKGQRLALDALREKRKRAKELHSFLTKCEQDPLCNRLHLQELLACVWQRLTKYQLLLEGIIKTVKDENTADPETSEEDEGLARLEKALNIAKDVLQFVNTAVKNTENLNRLKFIMSKLEIRGVSSAESTASPGNTNASGGVNPSGGVGASGSSSIFGNIESHQGEPKKFNLLEHSLVMEGTLSIRLDVSKQTTVLALFLSKCLVLLQKEADRYILKPIPRAGLSQPLSPIVFWNTVFFRPDASTKFGFLLLGINGRHMYELSTTNHSEYNMWIRHITEFANAGPRSGAVEEGPPPPLPANPPPSTIPSGDIISNGTTEPNASNEEPPQPPKDEDDGKTISGAVQTVEGEVDENMRSSVIDITTDLITPSSVAVISPPVALTAQRLCTPEERLRQAEEKIVLALQEAAEAAKETASARPSVYSAMEMLLGTESRKKSVEGEPDQDSANDEKSVSTMELLLTAQSHVNALTEVLLKALRVSPVDCSMTVCSLHMSSGLCDTCSARHSKYSSSTNHDDDKINDRDTAIDADVENSENAIGICNTGLDSPDDKMDSIVQLEEVGESSTDPCNDPNIDLINSSSLGLREILSTLIQRLPSEEKEREFLRARLQQSDQRLHRLHHLHKDCVITENHSQTTTDDPVQEISNSSTTDQSGGEG